MIWAVAYVGIASVILLAGRSYHLLLLLVIAAGWLQGPIAAVWHTSASQPIDDVSVLLLVGTAAVTALAGDRRDRRVLMIAMGLGAIVIVGIARSPDTTLGVVQARQVLLPAGLVLAGHALRDRIPWERVMRYVVFFAMLTVVWVTIEYALQRPLTDAASVSYTHLTLPTIYSV